MVHKRPQVLRLHLKRFRYDSQIHDVFTQLSVNTGLRSIQKAELKPD